MRLAARLVMLPAEFLIVTAKAVPLSLVASAGVVYLAELAPDSGRPFLSHW